MAIYESEFQGAAIDARLAAVATMQTAISNLETAVAAKYSKPAGGIPATDLDADVNAALAKANSAIQSLADYYTKTEVDALFAAVNSLDYVDVASLPTASASTLGKIYLVGPDGSGYYSYYYTSYDGTSYSWVGPLGTTEISLANYATKTELGQLDQKVDDISTGKYYGYYATAADLPDDATVDGFAYVGGGPTYTIYNCDGGVWTSSGITVNQSPVGNEEDIDQNEDGKLQFANRVYNPLQPNGMGYVILRKNKTFAEQVTQSNTIYEIRYDFDLGGASVTIPAGCILKFVGGSISNGTLNMQGSSVVSEENNIFRSVFVSGIKDNTIKADWFCSNGAINQGLLEYFAQTGGVVCFSDSNYTLTNVGDISLEDGTKFIGEGGNLTRFVLTPASGASYVFRIYNDCAFENIFFDVQVNPNQACDIIRFDTSRYNNITGVDPFITLRRLKFSAPYISASQTAYAITALHFLVRNFNDDGTTNGNKYNILSRRCDICDIEIMHCHSVVFEVIQNTLTSGQTMVYANSVAFEKFRITSNSGFKFIKTNNSSSTMTGTLGIEVKDLFAQILTTTISDDIKAVNTKGISINMNSTMIWDAPEPFLIDATTIDIISAFIPSSSTSADSGRFLGAKCINGGEIRYLSLPKQLKMPLNDFDPSTGRGIFVVSPAEDSVDLLFDGLTTLPKKRENLDNSRFERKVFGNNNYYFFDEFVDRNNNGYKKEIFDVSTGRHYILENFKYVSNDIVPLYNGTFMARYTFGAVMVYANSRADYTFTLNYPGTVPTLSLLGAYALGGNFIRIIKSTISGNVVTLTIDTTEWGGEYYSFSVVLLLRSQDFADVDLPTSVTGAQVNGSIKRKQGASDYRPTGVPVGFMYFDTTKGKMIVWNGTAWINMDGTPLT